MKAARSLLTKRRQSKETKLTEVADVLKKLFQMFGHPSVKSTVLFLRGNTDSKTVRGGFAKAEPLTLKFPEGGRLAFIVHQRACARREADGADEPRRSSNG